MSDHTPTTEQVRNIYANEREDELKWDGLDDDQAIFEMQAEFDRWLAEVERAAAEKAWDEAMILIYANAWVDLDAGVAPIENPYRKTTPASDSCREQNQVERAPTDSKKGE